MIDPYSTTISRTGNGVLVRDDVVPCTIACADGSACGVRHKVYFRYYDFKNQLCRRVIWICRHYVERMTLEGIHWTVQMNADLLDFMQPLVREKMSEAERWRDVQALMQAKYPSVTFKEFSKAETRPGKGKLKEYRGSCKNHYEKVIEAFSCGDVWEESVSRNAADNTIVNRFPKEQQLSAPRNTLSSFNDEECGCGHELGFHDANMKCTICKKLC